MSLTICAGDRIFARNGECAEEGYFPTSYFRWFWPRRKSYSSTRGFAFTLLIAQPLIPMEASRRAYCPARVRSARTLPFSKKNGRARAVAFDPAVQVVPSTQQRGAEVC